MKNLLARIEALERRQKHGDIPHVVMQRKGETSEMAWQRHMEKYGPPPRSPWPILVIPEDVTVEEFEADLDEYRNSH